MHQEISLSQAQLKLGIVIAYRLKAKLKKAFFCITLAMASQAKHIIKVQTFDLDSS